MGFGVPIFVFYDPTLRLLTASGISSEAGPECHVGCVMGIKSQVVFRYLFCTSCVDFDVISGERDVTLSASGLGGFMSMQHVTGHDSICEEQNTSKQNLVSGNFV